MTKIFNKSKLLLIIIVIIAAFFRLYDLDWDQNQHLHPDERFLTMVGGAMKVPETFADYLSPQVSTMNPANTGNAFYVYGTFPVIANKFLAMATGADDYNDFALLGRIFSAFVDVVVVIMLFKTVELFEKEYKLNKKVKYWTAFFYAIAVLPIQLSHFFTVDTFLNAFLFISFYSVIKFSFTKGTRWLLFCGLFWGMAVATKATAIFIGPLILYFIVNAYTTKWKIQKKQLVTIAGDLIIVGLTTYIVGRVGDPYLFQTGNFLDLTPSKLFLQNLKDLQTWSSPQAWYPPSVQWVHKTPILFALKNIVLYGVGIGFTICMGLGIFFLIKKIRQADMYIIFAWVFFFFLYQSLQTVQTMRYFLMLYPFFAILAGIGFAYIPKNVPNYVQGILLVFVVIWSLLFFSIYTKPITRYTASEWIYYNIPANSVILTESWDDALPLPIFDMVNRNYVNKQLPVFDPDTSQKWATINADLSNGNYLILSSNRGWGSIPTVPERYPRMIAFYKNLFAGKTAYKEVAQFTSYPSLAYLGIPLTIPDDNAEEAFTVYDHPKVMIFKNESK